MMPITSPPITNHHSPITTHHSTTSFTFISQDPELNASISRYYKYVHNMTITTCQLPLTTPPLHHSTTHHSPLTNSHSPIIIFNEMLIDQDICSFYPIWFVYGLHHHIRVYAFTMESTDFSCNLLNWEDFLKLSWQDNFSESIDFDKVPYFDNTRSHLTGVLKPHGGDSLYDLAASIHMTFANASQYIARIKSKGKEIPANFKPEVIDPGTTRFRQFLGKKPRHHLFLSMLPEAEQLFAAVKELGSIVDELEGAEIHGTNALENLSRLLSLIDAQTSFIHSFFLNLEPFLSGGVQ
jgi:hypothetical protein